MDKTLWREHRGANRVQSIALLAGMGALLAAIGWAAAGITGLTFALVVGVSMALSSSRVAPGLTLRMYRAQPVSVQQAPGLVRLVDELASRAGLPSAPRLYYVPAKMINAFAVGHKENSVVAVTAGLLRTLDDREVAGVIAHEISHIAHDDVWIMGIADMFSRLTGMLSTIGKFLLLLNVFGALFTGWSMSWLAIGLLVFAPMLSAMLQLALSRTREYDADMGAAALTGDPEGLASALAKLERHHARLFEHVLAPGRRVPDPSVLRTHPPTEERVERLLALRARHDLPELPRPVTDPEALAGAGNWHSNPPLPRRVQLGARALGLWY